MTENYPSPNEQQPPTFSEEETRAILGAQAAIIAARTDAEGESVSKEWLMGITPDGKFVAVDRGTNNSGSFLVRGAQLSELVAGEGLAEQKMFELEGAPGDPDVMMLRGSGSYIRSAFGTITNHGRGLLPTLDQKPLFPIDQEGRPYMPEGRAIRPEQVSVDGLKRAPRSGFRLGPRPRS